MFRFDIRSSNSIRLPLLQVFLVACAGFALIGCETVPTEDAVQIWVTEWPGTQDPEKPEALVVKGKELKCGLGDGGDLSFTPAQAANRVEFPDGAVIEAEGVRLTLVKAAGNTQFGRGDYRVLIRCAGSVSIFGPFGTNVEGWLGDSPDNGEAIPLSTGKLTGPVVLLAKVKLSSVMAMGHSMIFGSLEGSEKVPEEGTASEGAGEGTEEGTPEEGAGEGESGKSEPEDAFGWGTGEGDEKKGGGEEKPPEELSGGGEGTD